MSEHRDIVCYVNDIVANTFCLVEVIEIASYFNYYIVTGSSMKSAFSLQMAEKTQHDLYETNIITRILDIPFCLHSKRTQTWEAQFTLQILNK